VLKIKFAKAQGLLVERRKSAQSKELPNSLVKLFNWSRKRWAVMSVGALQVDVLQSASMRT